MNLIDAEILEIKGPIKKHTYDGGDLVCYTLDLVINCYGRVYDHIYTTNKRKRAEALSVGDIIKV